jgi:molybdopterin biosynthesis enzyme
MTAELVRELAGADGAEVMVSAAAARDARSIAAMIDVSACDLLVTTGGSGVGRTDAAIVALAAQGAAMTHGIALQPGQTAAVGRIGKVPVMALPGAPEQALAAWWALGLPVLDRLCGLTSRQQVTRPLARKIASRVGIAEIALLEGNAGAWMPLAVGELSLEAIAASAAWLLVPSEAEGFAAGTPVEAYLLRNG